MVSEIKGLSKRDSRLINKIINSRFYENNKNALRGLLETELGKEIEIHYIKEVDGSPKISGRYIHKFHPNRKFPINVVARKVDENIPINYSNVEGFRVLEK